MQRALTLISHHRSFTIANIGVGFLAVHLLNLMQGLDAVASYSLIISTTSVIMAVASIRPNEMLVKYQYKFVTLSGQFRAVSSTALACCDMLLVIGALILVALVAEKLEYNGPITEL